MTLDTKTITKIGKLAHIEIPEENKESLAKELSGIFGWIEELNEVDTDNVPQLLSVTDTALPWREDKVTDGGMRDKILFNAPAKEYGCFVVPKVISDE